MTSSSLLPGIRCIPSPWDLQEKGIISEPYTIKIKAYLDDLETRMQAGEYRFAKKTSIAEFLDHLVKGKGQIGVKVTIIEGWDIR